jgi:hypothetical protein
MINSVRPTRSVFHYHPLLSLSLSLLFIVSAVEISMQESAMAGLKTRNREACGEQEDM